MESRQGTYSAAQSPVPPSSEAQLHKKDASTAMILGIIGDVLVWYPVLCIAGFVLSIIALVRANRNRDFAVAHGLREHGMNVAGKWCGIGGIIVGAIMLLLYLAIFVLVIVLALGVAQGLTGILGELTLSDFQLYLN